jgi:hypothetical protein
MTDEDLRIERTARALAEHFAETPWDVKQEATRNYWRDVARKAVEAYKGTTS